MTRDELARTLAAVEAALAARLVIVREIVDERLKVIARYRQPVDPRPSNRRAP
jgi:hypothetical protein